MLGFWSCAGLCETMTSAFIREDLQEPKLGAPYWKEARMITVNLVAQPMTAPRPESTTTPSLHVWSVNNGKWIAFQLEWKDAEKSEAGPLGKFSDAVALQFPLKVSETPPPIFMGSKELPVHIFHWRAQYQVDREKGFHSMVDIYPNMNTDIYPLEFASMGNLKAQSEAAREAFLPGRAVGNPQSYRKTRGLDEIVAEGFGSSSVVESISASAKGEWRDGVWKVVITRPLETENGSGLKAGGQSYMAFAVWQGGHGEVGGRKSVTMTWTPLEIGVASYQPQK
jgi:hypothetical protein